MCAEMHGHNCMPAMPTLLSRRPPRRRAASELRLRLDGASRCRGALEAALRNLQRLGRQDDADAGMCLLLYCLYCLYRTTAWPA